MFISGESLDDISNNMNLELDLVFEWMNNNRLSFNISKTNYMIMSSHGKRYDPGDGKINIYGCGIDQVQTTKCLGLNIDEHLTWKSHIDYISQKISKGIGILLRARKALQVDSLITLYNSIIKPYFTYCITLWGNTFKTHLNKLVILQKKIIRLITFSDYRAHTQPLFLKLKFLTVKELYTYFSVIHIFKCIKCLYPSMFWKSFILNRSQRYPFNIQQLFYNKNMCKCSLRFCGPAIWNKLSKCIKEINSIYTFKKKVKTLLLSNID